MREYILPSPRPTSSDELAQLLRTVIVRDGVLSQAQADGMRITAEANADATHIERIHIDASRTKVTVQQLKNAEAQHSAAEPDKPAEPTTSTVAKVELASFDASPFHVGPLEIRAKGSAQHVRFAWVEDANGGLWVELLKSDAGETATANAEFELDTRDLEPLVRQVLEKADGKVKLLEFTPEVTTPNDREAEVNITLRCAYGIVRASIIVHAHVEIDDDMVLHVHKVKFSSKNPVLSLAYKALERVVMREGRIPEKVKINDHLPSGIELRDARIHALGTRVRLTAEVLAEGESDQPQ